MTLPSIRATWLVVVATACAGTSAPTAAPAAADPPMEAPPPAEPARPAARAAADPTTFACGNLTMSFGATVPPDFGISNQTDADCYAWQEFIAVNWPVAGSNFGAPGDLAAVQWLTYMDTHQLFQPGGVAPPPWGTPPQITAACQREAGVSDARARDAHPLINATKFSSQLLDSSDTDQAFPRGAPAWIGDSAGHNVWFEVRVNEDEYNYIVEHQFYNAEKQLAFYTSQQPVTTPIQLPAGCLGSTTNCPTPVTGAVEIKAGWMAVPDPDNARWRRYKLATAIIVDPKTQKCTEVMVALVALHIMHKTQSQPTWIWATFEHADNAPDDGAPPSQKTWSFYNASCAPQTVAVPAACQYKGQASVTTTCTPNQPPQYQIGDGCPAPTPTQVTRVNPIDSDAKAVNATVQAAIQRAFAGSVWQYYELVNVVWSTNPPVIPPACKAGAPGCQNVTAPQLAPSLNPSGAVASTILETYIQDHDPKNPYAKSNCLLCHVHATVPNAPAATPYASDFSFALGEAQAPAGSPMALRATKAKRPPGRAPLRAKPVRRIFR